jgi:hypothetical protein
MMTMAIILAIIAALQCFLMGSVEASSAVFTTMNAISSYSADSLDSPSVAPSLDGHHPEYISASLPHHFEVAGDAIQEGLQNRMQNVQVFMDAKQIEVSCMR